MAKGNDMKGKTCVVTGATSGIGRECAKELARQGARVILVGRDQKRGDDTLAEIKGETGNQEVELVLADLSKLAEVRKLAGVIEEKCSRLDVLMNNAGAFFMKRQVTEDNLELTFALNHMAYFLLTNLLQDLLIKSAPARVVCVSSALHFKAKIDWDDLQMEKSFSGMMAYNNSKLANVLFTAEMAERFKGKGVTVNCLHPGGVATRVATNNGFLVKMFMFLMRPFLISPAKGARTMIYLATSDEVQDATGKYFYKCQEMPSSPASTDVENRRRLWEISEKIANLNGE